MPVPRLRRLQGLLNRSLPGSNRYSITRAFITEVNDGIVALGLNVEKLTGFDVTDRLCSLVY